LDGIKVASKIKQDVVIIMTIQQFRLSMLKNDSNTLLAEFKLAFPSNKKCPFLK
jgi:hypothetical protein